MAATIGVTGVTGAVGGEVVRLLAGADMRLDLRLLARDPARAPDVDTDVRRCDYADPTGAREALLVPDTAIVTDQARKVVYVAAADGTVSARPITLGPVIHGLRIVAEGLTPADRVVIRGLQAVQPGQKAELRAGSIVPVSMVTASAETLPVPAAQATFAR